MSGGMAARRWETIGHPAALAAVEGAIASGRVPHAWLITGPEGVGRTTLALDLARALNCEADAASRPCGACRSCRLIARRGHPDVLVADMNWQREVVPPTTGDRKRDRRQFSIESIRALRADIATRPIHGRWKVQILDDAGLFSEDAPEAFLKTLEEPPPFAVLILIGRSPDQVRETVRSRCRLVALGIVGREEVAAELVRRGADAALAARIARVARGRLAWAIGSLASPDNLLRRTEDIEKAFEHLATPLGRAAVPGALAATHTQKRDATYALLDLWIGMWRDILLLRVGLSDYTQFPEVSERLQSWSAEFPLEEIHRSLEATRRCMQDLDSNVQARIALQAMVAQWPG